MPRALLTADQTLALLAETPRRLEAVAADLAPTRLRAPADSEGWSLNDVLAHLRSCADVRGGCVLTMLAEDGPTIRAVDPRTWIERTDYPDLEFRPSLRAFAAQRAELLARLESLPAEGWSRSATVTGAGAVQVRTVLFYAQWVARHERSHFRQIDRMAAAARTIDR